MLSFVQPTKQVGEKWVGELFRVSMYTKKFIHYYFFTIDLRVLFPVRDIF